MPKLSDSLPLTVPVHSRYVIVQKFCYYCPRALGADAETLICEDCERTINARDHKPQPRAQRAHSPNSLVRRIDAYVARNR